MKYDMFKCDQCGKTSEVSKGKFPYRDGWFYLYGLQTKVPMPRGLTGFEIFEGVQRYISDKHFCCMNCMIHFMSDRLNEWIDEKKQKDEKVRV
jgi:hypothetical protein